MSSFSVYITHIGNNLPIFENFKWQISITWPDDYLNPISYSVLCKYVFLKIEHVSENTGILWSLYIHWSLDEVVGLNFDLRFMKLSTNTLWMLGYFFFLVFSPKWNISKQDKVFYTKKQHTWINTVCLDNEDLMKFYKDSRGKNQGIFFTISMDAVI